MRVLFSIEVPIVIYLRLANTGRILRGADTTHFR